MLGSDSSQQTDDPFFLKVPQAFPDDSGKSQLHYTAKIQRDLESMSAKYLLFLYWLTLMIMCHSLSKTWQNNGAQVEMFDRLSHVPVTLFTVATLKSVSD